MTSAPVRFYAGFADERAAVLCFVGSDMRALVRKPRRLFALLKAAEAPALLLDEVRVVSASGGSAAVFVRAEDDAVVEQFVTMARSMAADLLDDDPALPVESRIVRRPLLAFCTEPSSRCPQATSRTTSRSMAAPRCPCTCWPARCGSSTVGRETKRRSRAAF